MRIFCRHCGATVAPYQLAKNGLPSPGDLAICHICGDVVIFEKDGSQRTARYSDAKKLARCQHDYVLAALARRPN